MIWIYIFVKDWDIDLFIPFREKWVTIINYLSILDRLDYSSPLGMSP
jgi:hypothetical protein